MKHVLIIDDDLDFSTLLQKSINKTKKDLLVTTASFITKEAVRDSQIDLILLDIKLNDANGLDILKDIREEFDNYELPVIILSAIQNQATEKKAFLLGANSFILKTDDLSLTRLKVFSHIEQRRIAMEAQKLKKYETVKKLVIALNHKINNPLCITKALTGKKFDDFTSEDLFKIHKMTKEIENITKRTEKLIHSDLEEENYGKETMFKL